MALVVSDLTKRLLGSNNITPILVLDIDGFESIYTSSPISDSRDWIDLRKSTNNLTQQLNQERGGASSVSLMKIRVVDKNGSVTRSVSPNFEVVDPLALRARVSLVMQGGQYPRDRVVIMVGVVSKVAIGQGYVNFFISHPEELKRQKIFIQHTAELVEDIDNSQNVFNVDFADGFYPSQDALKLNIRIEDEIMEVDSINGNELTISNRSVLNTVPNAHDAESEVTSFYTLEGDSISLALKLLLSGGENTNLSPLSVNIYSSGSIQNALFFDTEYLKEDIGFQIGDTVLIESVSNGSQERLIISFGVENGQSYIVLDGANLVDETSFDGSCSIKSKFNVLPSEFGCGCRIDQVDINEFLRIDALFTSIFPNHLFYLTEEKTASSFIDEKILFPSRLYSIPRKGKISIGITNPPLAGVETLFLNSKNVTNSASLEISRSINNYFYNAVIYKFNPDSLEQSNYLTQTRVLDADSINRIKSGLKALTIESDGLRDDSDTKAKVLDNINRYLLRYKFSAEPITVSCLFGESFTTEVGDTVFFGDSTLQVGDIKSGSRSFKPRVMEVINKSMNISTGKVELRLLDTNFAASGRFGVISISSEVVTGNESSISISPCFSETQTERQRWEPFIGSFISIRSPDFSYNETVELVGFSDNDTMVLNPSLPSDPQAGYIVTLSEYDQANDINKASFVFFNPQFLVDNVISQNIIEVSNPEYFTIGNQIRIHNKDFTRDSEDMNVTGIVGNRIEYFNENGFLPISGDLIELIGFKDGGQPYRLI